MNRATGQMRALAVRLIAFEAKANASSAGKVPGALRVCEKLRAPLATLMGVGGFHSVLGRALAVASVEVPWLKELEVSADGLLKGFDKPAAELAAKEFSRGEVTLVAQLLGLLVAFIGEELTLRLVREVWATVPLDGLDSNGGQNEETK
jgi:hypothetical protein